GNRAGTQYLYCTKRADNMSCEGCGTLRTAEFEQFVYEAMVHKLSEFQTLTAKAETVNPRLTALNVELAQVEDEIEKLLNTLTGASAVLMSYANGKIEELDTRRQGLIKEIAALNAENVSPQKIEYLSSHLGNWDNIDFDDRRQVADIILSQVQATAERVSFEWKI
ncbi:MAG: recombinase family protein, partial [Oscillospiraceae bacterium]|nr:recombinase family protein [Oscillospiraceae bacterium]